MNEKKTTRFLFSITSGIPGDKSCRFCYPLFQGNQRKRDQKWQETVFWQETIRRKESEDFNDDFKEDFDDDDEDWI